MVYFEWHTVIVMAHWFETLSFQACVRAVGAMSGGQRVSESDLVLLGQLPDANTTSGRFHSVLLSRLQPMRNDPVVSLLCLQEGKHKGESLESLFDYAEEEESPEVHSDVSQAYFVHNTVPAIHKMLLLGTLFSPGHSQPAVWCAHCPAEAVLPQSERPCCDDPL